MNCEQEAEHPWLAGEKQHLRSVLAAGTPALGVCLGAQLLAEAAGGTVTRMAAPDIGWTSIRLTSAAERDPVLGRLPATFDGFQWHSFELSPPAGGSVLAHSEACVEAFRLGSAPWWGIQFHAEVTVDSIRDWIDDYRSDPDAVDAAIDWDALRAESACRIELSNALGVTLCTGFLDHARTLIRS